MEDIYLILALNMVGGAVGIVISHLMGMVDKGDTVDCLFTYTALTTIIGGCVFVVDLIIRGLGL